MGSQVASVSRDIVTGSLVILLVRVNGPKRMAIAAIVKQGLLVTHTHTHTHTNTRSCTGFVLYLVHGCCLFQVKSYTKIYNTDIGISL